MLSQLFSSWPNTRSCLRCGVVRAHGNWVSVATAVASLCELMSYVWIFFVSVVVPVSRRRSLGGLANGYRYVVISVLGAAWLIRLWCNYLFLLPGDDACRVVFLASTDLFNSNISSPVVFPSGSQGKSSSRCPGAALFQAAVSSLPESPRRSASTSPFPPHDAVRPAISFSWQCTCPYPASPST